MQAFFRWVVEPFQRSRKLRAAGIAFLTIIVTAILNRERIDPNVLVGAFVLLASAYFTTVAWEDTANARADATIAAANVTAATQAATTTVTTPGTSDVTVSTPEPTKPTIAQDGLR